MTRNPAAPLENGALILNDDERAVIELYRALGLDGAEALRRLATPSSSPILPGCQELAANMSAVARDPFAVDPGGSAAQPRR